MILADGENAADLAKAPAPAAKAAESAPPAEAKAEAPQPKAAADEAVAWCRAGNGPFILEMQTYRYRGHSMSDPAKYRTRDEVEKVRHESDTIEQVRNRLLAAKVSEEELKKIDAEVREIVNASADFAQKDPEPDPSELWTDVYR